MYPWKEALSSWSESQLRIDALGLITILGTEEVNTSVGRLVRSRYVEFLPLLGAFVLPSNQFTKKQPNFVLYNLTDGIATTEVAGWLSRWLKAQDFHQVHHKIRWEAREPSTSVSPQTWTALMISIPVNGILLALPVLSGDWWGFANVLAMTMSIFVRVVLVGQNRAGIDNAIKETTTESVKEESDIAVNQPPTTNQEKVEQLAKVLVIMDDSKVVTMMVPRNLVRPVFTRAPKVPNVRFYRFVRWVGWVAFTAHIVSIGMASLSTQIFTVILIVLSTILTAFKFGCDDWRMMTLISRQSAGENEHEQAGVSCLISSRLKATCSEYPKRYDRWIQNVSQGKTAQAGGSDLETTSSESPVRQQRERLADPEAQGHNVDSAAVDDSPGTPRTERRRDLFIWLELTEDELDLLKAWGLVPQEKNSRWWDEFNRMRKLWKPEKRGTVTGPRAN